MSKSTIFILIEIFIVKVNKNLTANGRNENVGLSGSLKHTDCCSKLTR